MAPTIPVIMVRRAVKIDKWKLILVLVFAGWTKTPIGITTEMAQYASEQIGT